MNENREISKILTDIYHKELAVCKMMQEISTAHKKLKAIYKKLTAEEKAELERKISAIGRNLIADKQKERYTYTKELCDRVLGGL